MADHRHRRRPWDAGNAERAKHIISAAKSLKRKALDDSMIAHYFDATVFAGRAGLFASALRSAGEISPSRAQIFAEAEGLTKLDVRDRLVPWLERSNLRSISPQVALMASRRRRTC